MSKVAISGIFGFVTITTLVIIGVNHYIRSDNFAKEKVKIFGELVNKLQEL